MPDIELTPCTSTQVTGYGYDAPTRTLAIRFGGGGHVYHYSDVPQETYDRLVAAESKGKFIGAHIRGHYSHSLQLAADKQPQEAAAPARRPRPKA